MSTHSMSCGTMYICVCRLRLVSWYVHTIWNNFAFLFQVDPRCHIQSLVWYHDAPNGDKRLLKTARNASEPYVHTIIRAGDHHQGRYYCIINNVMGENECSAFLILRNASNSINRKSIAFITSKQIIIGIVLILHTLLLPAYNHHQAAVGSLLC